MLYDNRHKVSFDTRNTQYQAIYSFPQGYEPEVTSLLDILLEENSTFLDIGANWGYFSLYVASNPKFKGKIRSIEPYSKAYKDLDSIVNQTKLENTIGCYNLALSNYNGTGSMSLPDGIHSGLAELKEEQNGVVVLTLDSLNLAPSLIKIDAEGSETKIIEGGHETIKKHRPMIMLESWADIRNIEALVKLVELGYVFFHPCWKNGKELYTQDYVRYSKLCLMPITVEDRLIRQHQINVFACHKTRLKELKESI